MGGIRVPATPNASMAVLLYGKNCSHFQIHLLYQPNQNGKNWPIELWKNSLKSFSQMKVMLDKDKKNTKSCQNTNTEAPCEL